MNTILGLYQGVREEMMFLKDSLRRTKMTAGFAFAIFCVGLIIVGNVGILISINFWLSIFTDASVTQRGQQIAIQVITMTTLFVFFATLSVIFVLYCGIGVIWRTLTDTNRVRSPWYRFLLLSLSGSSNAVSSLLGTYAINDTPQFVQAILMCTILFSAQAWTVIAIPDERRRNYRSVFFIASLLCAVAGILLGSLMYFLNVSATTAHVSWSWTLIYFISCIIFGYWCVVQRLYLEAVAIVKHEDENKTVEQSAKDNCIDTAITVAEQEEECMVARHRTTARQWQWGQNTVDDISAKLMLLVVGIFIQALVSFVLFPVDAIPSFGMSSDVLSAWYGFCGSVRFIFHSWYNIQYGVIYFIGFAMSFAGCTYLNEYSPTLASMVLQLAGPVTSLMIILVPRWNVYHIHSNVGQQTGSVVLLIVSALLYYLWENRTTRQLADAARIQERAAYSPI